MTKLLFYDIPVLLLCLALGAFILYDEKTKKEEPTKESVIIPEENGVLFYPINDEYYIRIETIRHKDK